MSARNKPQPTADGVRAALGATVRADPVARLALAVAAGAAAIYLSPLSVRAFELADRLIAVGFLFIALLALRRDLARIADREERRFWRDLSLAFACWWLVAITRLLTPLAGPPPLAASLLTDVLFAAFYVFLALAAERHPSRRSPWRPAGLEATLAWPAITAFVLGLLAYFVLIPALVDPVAYHSQQPSVLLYIALDVYLTGKLLFLYRAAEPGRWRAIYSLLAITTGIWLVNDVAVGDALLSGRSATWRWALDLLWLIALVLAARVRHQRFAEPAAAGEEPAEAELEVAPALTGLTISSALALPVLHTVLEASGLSTDGSRLARERLIVVWLVLLGAIALIQQRLLRRRNDQLWRARSQVETSLRKSEEELRLQLERRRSSARLRAEENRFGQVFRACPSGFVLSRLRDDRVLEVNDSFARLTGYGRREAMGRTGVELGLWAGPEDRLALLRAIDAEGRARDRTVVFRHRDGRRRTVVVAAARIQIGGERCLLTLARDVTARRRAEAGLRRRAAWLEQARDAIVVLDADQRVRGWNGGAARLFGWPPASALGRDAREVLQPADGARWSAAGAAARDAGGWRGTLTLAARDGRPIAVDSRWTLVRDVAGDDDPLTLVIQVPVPPAPERAAGPGGEAR